MSLNLGFWSNLGNELSLPFATLADLAGTTALDPLREDGQAVMNGEKSAPFIESLFWRENVRQSALFSKRDQKVITLGTKDLNVSLFAKKLSLTY